MQLADGILSSDARAVARALTLVETGGSEARELLVSLRGRLGRAWTVGFTGAPGVGKSTLLQALGLGLTDRGERVAALAVDPSSPFSGGALLGDRVRMTALLEAGAFVRSMATRGSLGGLSAAAADAVDVLDAAGYDWVLVETVGVGQDEVDVARAVDTVVVVTVPGLGDEIQAAKAGLLEIADIFAVNKADRPGVEGEVGALEGMLELVDPSRWKPPVLKVQATERSGIAELREAIERHREYLESGGRREERRRARAAHRLRRVLSAMVEAALLERLGAEVAGAEEAVGAGDLDVRSAAEGLLARLFGTEVA